MGQVEWIRPLLLKSARIFLPRVAVIQSNPEIPVWDGTTHTCQELLRIVSLLSLLSLAPMLSSLPVMEMGLLFSSLPISVLLPFLDLLLGKLPQMDPA